MRLVPDCLKPLAAYLLPHAWAVAKCLRQAKRKIGPIVEERHRLEASGSCDYQKPNDFFPWMIDEARDGREKTPTNLVHRLLVLALASVHTTSMATTQVIFDLCARPEYINPLRNEIQDAIVQNGGWEKTTLSKMWKVDSFMRESQRLNPPSLSK